MKLRYHYLLALLFAIVIPVAKGAQGSAEQYGKALGPQKVPGVGPCQAVAVVGEQLFATGRGEFYVLDISDATNPTLTGQLSGLGGQTRQIFIQDSIAYVTARQDGLWLIDISNPSRPAIISHYDTVEMATGICVSGPVAFVATRQYGVEIIDVSDPASPRHLSMLKTGEAQSCWARDGYLYIGDWAPQKLLIADVRNPREPVIVGEAELDGYGDGGCLHGNYCFAATGHHSRAEDREAGYGKGHGLEIYDFSEVANPRLVSRVKFPPSYQITNDMWTARVSGNRCVVADTWNGVFVVNIEKIEAPEIIARAVLPLQGEGEDAVPDPVGGVALGDGVIYTAGIFTGLYVIPAPGIDQPEMPEPDKTLSILPPSKTLVPDPGFLAYRPEGQVRSVTVVDDVAWTACGAAGIQAVALGESLKPLSVTKGKGDVFHVAVSGDRLYAAENRAGLAVYQIGSDYELTEISRLIDGGRSIKQVACPPPGRFALFHCGSAQASIADFKDLVQPKIVLRDSQVGLFYGDQLLPEKMADRFLVAYWHRSGPAWYDVSGNVPVAIGNTPDEHLYSFGDGVCRYRDKLLMVKRGKLQLLEAGETRNVASIPTISVPKVYFRGRPTTDGKTLALSCRPDQEVQLFDISDIENPKPLKTYHFDGHPGACGFWKGRPVIPAGYEGLLMER
ncbi:MAG: hypothetical protein KA152_13910 [Verrucomicrobiales bacterium]|nr:hypothetical protein [Verrucomicrobiales bacterium]